MARLDYRASGYFERTPETKSDFTIPRWTIALTLVLLLLIFISWFFTRAPWLQVRDIRIEGQATDETKAEIEKLRGKNILWLSITSPELVIKQKQPSIKEIQILRGIPDTLRVKLIERQPTMIWESNGIWYTTDANGFVFREQPINRRPDGTLEYPPTGLPVILDKRNIETKVGQVIVPAHFVNFVKTIHDRLMSDVNLRFVRGEIDETVFNVTIVTDAGWSILFDRTRSIDAQFHTLKRVLETKRPEIREYVDVRVRGWVYYK